MSVLLSSRVRAKMSATALILVLLLAVFFPLAVAYAEINPVGNLQSLGKNTTDIGLKNGLGDVLGSVLKGILALVGMIFLILMVYAGILWMTAGGNDEKAESAQKIVTMAVIGLVVIMAAYAITVFVTISMGGTISK